ncbi:radical SAM family heme chaperone HemW [Sporocytophaga myxococcoides]|nr:radical SAM family heme chaperone HemW [Sporocytophaga myxococcoides]
MSGIYIHIPFCRQACHYCDFHFSTNLSLKEKMVEAICMELKQRKSYINENINTIYFGGGTPSLLLVDEIRKIIDEVKSHYKIDDNAEVTIEVNPDDITQKYLKGIKQAGINRLSIGVQAFQDNLLTLLNRAHNSKKAINSIEEAREQGFYNITADLIYGIPGLDKGKWEDNIQTLVDLGIPHISAYALTIEEKTVLGKRLKKGKFSPEEEENVALQFEDLVSKLEKASYEQYEISNFAKEGNIARHNSSYWLGAHYLGLGPSAHSYNGISRQYNISNNHKYIEGITTSKPEFTIEHLTDLDKANEYFLTRLRTKWGCDLREIKQKFNLEVNYYIDTAKSFIEDGFMIKEDNFLKLTPKGKLIADKITEAFFII